MAHSNLPGKLRNFYSSRLKLAQELSKRFGWVCWYCQGKLSAKHFELEHIIPRSRGGGSQLSNLALACKPCNRAKGTGTLQDFYAWLKRAKEPVEDISLRLKLPEDQWGYLSDYRKGYRQLDWK